MTLVIQTKAMEQVPALWNLQISLEIFRCLNSCQRRKNGCGQKTGRKKTIITWVSGGSKFTGGGGFMHIEFYYNFAKWWIKVSWLSHTQMSVTIIPQTRQKKKNPLLWLHQKIGTIYSKCSVCQHYLWYAII